MQKCVDDIQEWYEQNKLVINRSKSNVMLVTNRQMFYHMVDKELNVLIDNQKLLQCTSMTYLGVEIDNTLSWDAQTNDVCKNTCLCFSANCDLCRHMPHRHIRVFQFHNRGRRSRDQESG